MTQQEQVEEEEEQEEQEQLDEFDETKERQDRRMPIIYSYANAATQAQYAKDLQVKIQLRDTFQQLVRTHEFKIVHMHMKDSTNQSIIGSFAIYYVEPHKRIVPLEIESIPGIKAKKNIWYEILGGKGLLIIQDYSEIVIQGDLLLVEQDVKHNFFNTGEKVLVIKCLYDGFLDLRDRYTPTAKITQEAKESKEKFFNVQSQQFEDKGPKDTAANKQEIRNKIPVPTAADQNQKIKRFRVQGQSVTKETKSDEKFL